MKRFHEGHALSRMEDVIEQNLPKACAELSEWWDTGLLREGVIREAAALVPEEIADQIHSAERLVEQMAVRSMARSGEAGKRDTNNKKEPT